MTKKVARCRFSTGTRLYDYAIPERLLARTVEGCHAVVDGKDAYSVVRVIEVIDAVDSEWHSKGSTHKPLVDVVDDAPYLEIAERRRKFGAVQRELDRLVQKQERILDYERMAETEPRIGELLKELKLLSAQGEEEMWTAP